MSRIFQAVLYSVCFSLIFLGFPQARALASVTTAPTISTFSPMSGAAETAITLTGTNFSNVTSVQFNGVNDTSFIQNSHTKLTAHVPWNATTGTISVTTSSGNVTTVNAFTVTLGIALSTNNGPPTTKIVIAGTGFSPNEGIVVTSDTSVIGTTTAASEGGFSINVQIPATATHGSHFITATGATSGKSAQQSFLVQTNWEYTGFNASNSWSNPYENVLTSSTIAQASPKWNIHPLYYTHNWNEPLLYKNVLYLTDDDGNVYAYNSSSGAFLWKYAVNTGVAEIQTPFVVDNVLMIFAYTQIFALNATTGTLLWSGQEVNNININTFYSIGVVNNIFYAGDDIGDLYAYQLTGCGNLQCNPLWIHTFSHQRIAFRFISGNDLFTELRTGPSQATQFQVYNLNDFPSCGTATCTPLWSSPIYVDGNIRSVSSSKIYAVVEPILGGYPTDEIVAFNITGCGSATCTPIWTTAMPYAMISPVAVSSSYLYVTISDSYDNKGQFYALSVGTGAIKWSTVPSVAFTQEVMVANGVVYAYSVDGNLYAYASQGCGSATCSSIWKYTLAGKYGFPTFIVANGYLYLSSNDASLYAFSV